METNDVIIRVSGISNIVYEEPERFRNSVSYKYYKQALKMTEEIVRSNFDITIKERDHNGPAVSGSELRNSRQLYNVIFFTGDRGTGKTSAMLSYMEFLKDYYRSVRDGKINDKDMIMDFRKNGGYNYDNVMFTGLEYIDASILGEKEDILGSVLAQMLKKWRDEENRSTGGIVQGLDYEHKKRKLQKLFSEVYEYRRQILSEKRDEDNSEMFMDNLKNMSMTFNLQIGFSELVRQYLDIMVYPRAENVNKENHFLVICIDDLDLNITKGFQLLEQIRKYLMTRNIIVLMSADYEQLNKICCNHYFAEFDKLKSENLTEYVGGLAREYLQKIIPVQRQILMPSGGTWSLLRDEEIKINYKAPVSEEQEIGEGTLYSIVYTKMKEQLEIAWDKGGKCIHYLAPATLRELGSWVIEAYGRTDKSAPENRKEFLRQDFIRICRKYLSDEDQKCFFDAETLDAESQIEIMYQALDKYVKVSTDLRVEKPKIGDVMELISRALVMKKDAVVLASLISIYFTLKLTPIEMKLLEPGDEKRFAENELRRYFGYTVWSNWEKKLIGKVYCNLPGTTEIYYGIAGNDSGVLKDCLSIVLEGEYKAGDETSVNRFIRRNKEKLIDYQYILLFYHLRNTDVYSDPWVIEAIESTSPGAGKTTKYRQKLGIAKGMRGDFSLSHVLLNLLSDDTPAMRFMLKFTEVLGVKKPKDFLALHPDFSIWYEMRSWLGAGKTLVPLGNIEFLTDMAQKISYHLGEDVILSGEDISIIVEKYFETIRNCLSEYDKRAGTEYLGRFNDCPLFNRMKEEHFMKALNESIVKNVQSESTSRMNTVPVMN